MAGLIMTRLMQLVLILGLLFLSLPARAAEAGSAPDVPGMVETVEPVEEPLGTMEQLLVGSIVVTGAFTIGMIATGSLATGIGVASAVAISYAFLP